MVLSPLNKGILRFSSLPSSLPSSPPHPSQKDKKLKYPHLSMCRTFSPYKIRGEYFSLCASTQIKISASHLCLFRDITYWSEQKHRLLSQSKKQEEHHLWRHHGDMGGLWEGWKKSLPCSSPLYNGVSSDYGRDEGFFARPANLQNVSLIFEDSCQTCCNSY